MSAPPKPYALQFGQLFSKVSGKHNCQLDATMDMCCCLHLSPSTPCLIVQETQAIFYNWKPSPVQRMLDFDFICGRPTPSVACVVQPGAAGFQKVFFGNEEIAIPVAARWDEMCSPVSLRACTPYRRWVMIDTPCTGSG